LKKSCFNNQIDESFLSTKENLKFSFRKKIVLFGDAQNLFFYF